MSSIIYPSSFASSPTLTLHNGTTHKAAAIVIRSAVAQLDYIVLPNKVLYDPNGSGAAPRLPDIVVAKVAVQLANKTAIVTEFEAMCNQVGVKAILTGTKISGGTLTCTARLEQVENVSPFLLDIDRQMEVQLTFRPLTTWV